MQDNKRKTAIFTILAFVALGILATSITYIYIVSSASKDDKATAPASPPHPPTPTTEDSPLPEVDPLEDHPADKASPEFSDIVDRLLQKMASGAIAFNTPSELNIKDSYEIQLILSTNETIEEIKQSITEEGEREGAKIKISNRMEARLSGYMFQITALTPEAQAISKNQKTEWKWEIQPKEEGQHKLHLTLTALLDINGHSTSRSIQTFSKTIKVNVTTPQRFETFFKNNWQWLWAAILVPVTGLLLKRRKSS